MRTSDLAHVVGLGGPGEGVAKRDATSNGRRQRLARLSPLEAARQGEQLSVIWELEVGPRILCPGVELHAPAALVAS